MDKRQFSGSRFRTFVAFFYRDEPTRTFILLLFCVFIMHTWLIITLRSRLHSVFTIVGRGEEEKI